MNQEPPSTAAPDPCQGFMVTADMIIQNFKDTLEAYGAEGGAEFIKDHDKVMGYYAGWRAMKKRLEDLLKAYREEQEQARARAQETLLQMMVMKIICQTHPVAAPTPAPSKREERPKVPPSEKHIKRCLQQLMDEKDSAGRPLFCRASHWQAVFSILAELMGYKTNDFDYFDELMTRIQPDNVNEPYSRQAVKNISQTPFFLPFDQWKFDNQTMKKRKPFQRMVDIAQRFKELLEEPPEANPLPDTLPDA